MEALGVLEEKIRGLIGQVLELREANDRLVKEKIGLEKRVEAMEGSLLKDNRDLEDLNQEKTLTKVAVDDLIKSIDALVGDKGQGQ